MVTPQNYTLLAVFITLLSSKVFVLTMVSLGFIGAGTYVGPILINSIFPGVISALVRFIYNNSWRFVNINSLSNEQICPVWLLSEKTTILTITLIIADFLEKIEGVHTHQISSMLVSCSKLFALLNDLGLQNSIILKFGFSAADSMGFIQYIRKMLWLVMISLQLLSSWVEVFGNLPVKAIDLDLFMNGLTFFLKNIQGPQKISLQILLNNIQQAPLSFILEDGNVSDGLSDY